MYDVMKEQMLLSSAEKMPEDGYSFRPADTVRTFGQKNIVPPSSEPGFGRPVKK